MAEKFDRTSPEGAVKHFGNCILIGDLNGALECFHADATYIERGAGGSGLENIKKALAGGRTSAVNQVVHKVPGKEKCDKPALYIVTKYLVHIERSITFDDQP